MRTPGAAPRILRRPRHVSNGRTPISLWTLAVRALKRHKALALAQCLALALALAVPLCLRSVQDGAAQAGYQSLLATGSGVVIIEEPRIASPDGFAEFQQRITQLVNSEVGRDLQLVTTYTRAGSFRINIQNGKASPGDVNLTAASYPDLLSHATLVNGAWPDGKGAQSPIPVALSQTGAAEAGDRT